MRSASACAGSLCAPACYVRARACACSSHACANEISMRVDSRDCLKGLRKKRGEIKPRLNGFDHPIQSITFCSRHHTDKFTVFSFFFLGLFFSIAFTSFCVFQRQKVKKRGFLLPTIIVWKQGLDFLSFSVLRKYVPRRTKSKAPSLHFSSFSARFSSYSTNWLINWLIS